MRDSSKNERLISFKPIGIVHVRYSDDIVRNSINGVDGIVEVFPEYEEGLETIEGYSHVILVSYLHKVGESNRSILKVRFRKWERLGVNLNGIPYVGVFATDSPHRPNPIGVSIVKLIRREGRFLYVENLDLFDGTPILDIKGYGYDRIISDIRVPKWYVTLVARIKEKFKNASETIAP